MTDFTADARGILSGASAQDSSRVLAWEPAPPARKRRLGLWIGLGVGALVVAGTGAAASAVLIAPGTTIAGISVGGLTPGMAAERVTAALDATEVTVNSAGVTAMVTGAELGITVDAQGLAETAHSLHPMWDIGGWNPEPAPFVLTVDPDSASDTLRSAVPAAWEAPVDATVVFDDAAGAYVVTPAAPGTGLDLDALTQSVHDALVSGQATVDFSTDPIAYEPAIADSEAVAMQEHLNTLLTEVGFYVGDERVVAIDAPTAASWLQVVADDGELRVETDAGAIQQVVDTIPEQANRPPVDATIVVNSRGSVLREVTGGQPGYEITSTEGIAEAFAEQLASGTAKYPLEVTETPFGTTEVVRRIEVDLSEQRLWMYENDQVIDSWRVSSGKPNTPTYTGTYTIGWKTPSQTMTGYERRNGERFIDPNWRGKTDSRGYAMFEQPNVKWAMYFNGDQAFHGVYWHSNWGTRMSHGCVGMPDWRAKQLYEWSPQGLEVTIRS